MTRPGDDRNYVQAVKEQLAALIAGTFAGARVYFADVDNIPAFGEAGTFCLEAGSSAVDTAGRVVVALRIWSYVEETDAAAAEQKVSALAQRLEAAIWAATREGPNPDFGWLATEYLETTYLPREKGRALRRRYLRAGRTDWRVRLAVNR